MSDRWAQANAAMGFYVVLKVFSGYRTCASQPDRWHQYGPAKDVSEVKGHAYSVSPGFDKLGESGPRLTRDPARWEQSVRSMVASGATLMVATSSVELTKRVLCTATLGSVTPFLSHDATEPWSKPVPKTRTDTPASPWWA